MIASHQYIKYSLFKRHIYCSVNVCIVLYSEVKHETYNSVSITLHHLLSLHISNVNAISHARMRAKSSCTILVFVFTESNQWTKQMMALEFCIKQPNCMSQRPKTPKNSILPLTVHTKVSEVVDQVKTLDVNRPLV